MIELAWLLSPSSLSHKKGEDRTDRKHLGNWKTVRYSVILERTIKFVFLCKIRERRVNLYPCAKELLEFILPSDVDIQHVSQFPATYVQEDCKFCPERQIFLNFVSKAVVLLTFKISKRFAIFPGIFETMRLLVLQS